jgi:hypothetical protein
MKETLASIIGFFIGYEQPQSNRLFGLFCKETNDVSIIIYINSISLINSSNSVVIDAAVSILTDNSEHILLQWLNEQAANNVDVRMIPVSEEEIKLWKKILPVLNERCRNTWHHNIDTCCYYSRNIYNSDNNSSIIPHSLEKGHEVITA